MTSQHQDKIAESRTLACSFLVLNAISATVDFFAGGSDGLTLGGDGSRPLPFDSTITIAGQTIESVPAVGVSLVVQLLFMAFCVLILKTYQNRQAQGLVFYAFTCLGVASLFFVQIVFFVPVMWLLMGRNMMALTPRMVAASLLGTALPYWFVLAYFVLMGDVTPLGRHFAFFIAVGADSCRALPSPPLIGSLLFFILLIIIAVFCTTYYFRNSYKDNINVRMRIEMTISLTTANVIFAVLQPQHLMLLSGVMIVMVSALIAHCRTLHGSSR